MWARITSGAVVEITDINPEGRFHESLVWIKCADIVQLYWRYDGKHFYEPSNIETDTPQQVTRAQVKAALITAGLWDLVLEYVESIEDVTERALAQVTLHDTTHWHRASPFLEGVAEALGITSEQLDDLFLQAIGIHL